MSTASRNQKKYRTFLVTCGVMFTLLFVLSYMALVQPDSWWGHAASVVGATLVFVLTTNSINILISHTISSGNLRRIARLITSALVFGAWLYIAYRASADPRSRVIAPSETFIMMSCLWALIDTYHSFDDALNHDVYQLMDMPPDRSPNPPSP